VGGHRHVCSLIDFWSTETQVQCNLPFFQLAAYYHITHFNYFSIVLRSLAGKKWSVMVLQILFQFIYKHLVIMIIIVFI